MIAMPPEDGAGHPYSRDCRCPDCLDAIGNQAASGDGDPRAGLASVAEEAMSLANEAMKLADSPGADKLACLMAALEALAEARRAAVAMKD